MPRGNAALHAPLINEAPPGPRRFAAYRRLSWSLVAVLAAIAVGAAIATHLAMAAHVAGLIRRAAWLLPLLVAWHLGQLFLAALGWRCLLAAPPTGIGGFWRLRIVREGIDSLLPVAQVGGELVGSRLLARRGMTLGGAGASVIVDVSLEVSTQLVFLLSGLACLGLMNGHADGAASMKLVLAVAVGAVGIGLAQAGGGLRALEALSDKIVRRWPALGDVSLLGLHEAARVIYGRHIGVVLSLIWHGLAWLLGTMETFIVLRAMGLGVTPAQAFVIESLGMAARSAGFAIPAALGAQEGGFVLAAAAVGVAAPAALALSLTKRLREIAGGLIGLTLWRLEAARGQVAIAAPLPQTGPG